MSEKDNNILLFDGVCNLCNGAVQFILKRDSQGKFKFASLQSEPAQKLLEKFRLPVDTFRSFVLIQGDQYSIKSTAALSVLKEIGGFWKIFYVFILVPRKLRDFFYDLVAKSRYRIFGKRETCMIPAPELKDRFME